MEDKGNMKLFLISQYSNIGYDTYDSAVVVAETEDDARLINPSGEWGSSFSAWCKSPKDVIVEYLGESISNEKQIVCASFNAG